MLNPNAIQNGSITQEMIDASVLDAKQDVIDDLYTIREGAKIGNEAFDIITSMVNAGYLFAGIATPITDPSEPNAKVFYIANGKGTYEKFGGINVTEDEVVVLYWDSSWHKVSTGIASQAKLSELDEKTTELIGGERIIAIPILEGATKGFYTQYLKISAHDSAVYYEPIDLSEYIGSLVKIHFKWDKEPTTWTHIGLKANNDINTNGGPSDITNLTREIDIYNNAKGGEYTLEFVIDQPYLFISKRYSSTIVDVSVIVNSSGEIQRLDDEIFGIKGSVSALDGKVEEAFGSTEITDVDLGIPNTGGYYNSVGNFATYTSTPTSIYYNPIDLSQYIGSKVLINFKWSKVPSVWTYLFFRSSPDLSDKAPKYSTPISEKSLYDLSTNNEYSVELVVEYPYLCLSKRYEDTIVSVQVVKVNKGRLDIVEDAIEQIGGAGVVYVSPQGNDNAKGTKEEPLLTIQKALEVSSSIIVRGGFYEITQEIDLSKCKSKIINIRSEENERVILFGGTKISEIDGSAMSGYTKVRQINVGTAFDFDRHWIFQYGVDDPATLIESKERTAYHKRLKYRCDFTAIQKVNSIEEVESFQGYAFYYESGTLYLSRPVAVSSVNFLWLANVNLFSNTEGKKLLFNGLVSYGRSFNIRHTINSIIEDCKAIGCHGSYAWSLDGSKNLLLINCEASRADTIFSSSAGDGFNIHTASSLDNKVEHCSYELRNCWSHDNWNDGYSNHEYSDGYINGGLYEHNCVGGGGAGITPAYGAQDIIKDAITQSNGARGLQYSGYSDVESDFSLHVLNVVSRFNKDVGFNQLGNKVVSDFVNCVAYDNGKSGFDGYYGIMRCINCKSVNNKGENYANNPILIGSE